MMVANDVIEVTLRKGEEELVLRRPGPPPAPTIITQPSLSQPAVVPAPPAPTPPPTAAPSPEPADSSLHQIKSPLVGIFYAARAPGEPPLVKPGDRVTPETVVCIIGSMKHYNDIKAEVSGIVEKVYVVNEQGVGKGQPLFGVRLT